MSAAETTTQITALDSVAIVAREPAMGPHPHTRQLVPYKGIEKVLLADERETHICMDCGWHHPNVGSVIAHRNGTHLRRKKERNLHSVETIKTVLRAVKLMERDHPRARNIMALAAENLNLREVPTLRGASWTAAMVSHLYRTYNSKYKVHAMGRPRGVLNGTVESEMSPTSRRPNQPTDLSLLAEVNSALVLANHLQQSLASLLVRVEAGEWGTGQVDPVIAEKAARLDQLQAILGGNLPVTFGPGT